MEGRIDDRNRVLLRLELVSGDSLLAVVDTGFTRELLTHRAKVTELGLKVLASTQRVVVADGRFVSANAASVTVIWHGKPLTVTALIIDTPIDPNGGDAPTDCLVGVEMMMDSELLIEFAKKVFLLVPIAMVAV
jgi:predicted aspartyl protease